MKLSGILYLNGFAVFVLLIGLACGAGATPISTTMQPTQTQPPAASETSTTDASANQQFTKYSNFLKRYSAEVPSDWITSSVWLRALSAPNSHLPPNTLTSTWKSPNQNGAVVFLEYDVNQKVAAAQIGAKAKLILDWFFGKDGYSTQIGISEDNVNITDNNPLPDGSIHLSWGLVNNKMVGTSYVYERGSDIIVLSTLCVEAYSDAFANIFAHIANSYKVP